MHTVCLMYMTVRDGSDSCDIYTQLRDPVVFARAGLAGAKYMHVGMRQTVHCTGPHRRLLQCSTSATVLVLHDIVLVL